MKDNLHELGVDLHEITGDKSHLVNCNAQPVETLIFPNRCKTTLVYLSSLYTQFKSFRTDFYAYKRALFFNLSSLAVCYVTPQLIAPNQLASMTNKPANDEIIGVAKFFSAVCCGHESSSFEIQLALHIFIRPLSSQLS